MRNPFRSNAAIADFDEWRRDTASAAPDARNAPGDRDRFGPDSSIHDLAAELEAMLRRDGRPAEPAASLDVGEAAPAQPSGLDDDYYMADMPDAAPAGPSAPPPLTRVPQEQSAERPSPHLDELASLLAARQVERSRRGSSDLAPHHTPADDDHGYPQPAAEEAAEGYGSRFGWQPRDEADFASLDDEPLDAHPRRSLAFLPRLAAGIASAVALVAVSAVAAFYIVSLGGEENTVAEEPAAAEQPAQASAATSWDGTTASADATPAPAAPAPQEQTAQLRPTGQTGQAFAMTPEPGVRTVGPAREPRAPSATENQDAGAAFIPPSAPPPASRPATESSATTPAPTATRVEPSATEAARELAQPSGATASQLPAPTSASAPTATDDGDPGGAVSRDAQTTTYVNMRSGPENEAAVITIVPANATVGLVSCEVWCEVVFEDQRGWIYRDFIRDPQAGSVQ